MWILSFLPNWLFHYVVCAGILAILSSIFLGFIPLVSQYKIPLKYIGFVLLALGIFFEGAIYNNEAWVARVKEMEAKVAKAEEESIIPNIIRKQKARAMCIFMPLILKDGVVASDECATKLASTGVPAAALFWPLPLHHA